MVVLSLTLNILDLGRCKTKQQLLQYFSFLFFTDVPESSWLDCYDVSAELDVQSVYCQLATVKVSHDSFNNKRHYWDNIVYLGIIMIRVTIS